jgi:hypothetical protein
MQSCECSQEWHRMRHSQSIRDRRLGDFAYERNDRNDRILRAAKKINVYCGT